MKANSETSIEYLHPDDAKKSAVCPALLLMARVMCNAPGHFHQPSRRQIRECCIKEDHISCPLRSL